MNKEEGVWLRWDTLGNMIDSTVYKNGQKILNGIYTYYPNGIIQSFKVYDLINHKSSSETYFDNKGVIVNESDSANIGDSDIVFIKTEIEASFPGGQSAWLNYIKGHIDKNMDALTKSHQSGTCRIEFIVDKLGNVTHVVALTMKNSILAEVCVDAVLNGPKWIPARQNGRSVKALRQQPITFTMVEQ